MTRGCGGYRTNGERTDRVRVVLREGTSQSGWKEGKKRQAGLKGRRLLFLWQSASSGQRQIPSTPTPVHFPIVRVATRHLHSGLFVTFISFTDSLRVVLVLDFDDEVNHPDTRFIAYKEPTSANDITPPLSAAARSLMLAIYTFTHIFTYFRPASSKFSLLGTWTPPTNITAPLSLSFTCLFGIPFKIFSHSFASIRLGWPV